MPKICYAEKKFGDESLRIIQQANAIIRKYAALGYAITLCQLYYQFVAAASIENSDRSYKRLGSIISDARRAGMVDWEAIEDRMRNLRSWPTRRSPEAAIEAAASAYLRDLWANQPTLVEVWAEKDALIGLVQEACSDRRAAHFACRGYVSDSELWSAAQRYRKWLARGSDRTVDLIHLGDHDPSGIDMTRDIGDRLRLFGVPPERLFIQRLALNRDQIDRYKPPPNPAKTTDARFKEYRVLHGDESWELDALEPTVLVGLIREAVDARIAKSVWDADAEREERERDQIRKVGLRWGAIQQLWDRLGYDKPVEEGAADDLFDSVPDDEDEEGAG